MVGDVFNGNFIGERKRPKFKVLKMKVVCSSPNESH